ncbi:ATP-binding cassette domain-containing protein [Oceanotoga sp. DSM 15011]|nr:ATP-binding cassette domain-containing protein [Oceanotoga sp. DSM 15011]MDO7975377.1 ATP-binding cassette domain-containing protein [Oceanotoga teriensis]UYP00119.1 ATP-binding cassette domain-containing protein [Oceanotoga sp. DSM 15011]
MTETILKVKNLNFAYKKNIILKNINVHFQENQLYSIYGPSGSGKSTLLYLLGGLIKDKNKNIIKKDNLKVGFLFQTHNLIKELSIYENIKISQLIKNEDDDEKIYELLKEMGIYHIKNNYPDQISGGEAQRVSFIRTLIADTKIILCDEPTASLDTKNKEIIYNIISQYKKNKLIIIATHDENVKKYSDKTFNLIDGNLEEGG